VTPLLRAVHIRKSFGGVRALKGVSFDLFPGEVHALVGENGAGKSTLIKVLTAAIQPDEGELWLDGQHVHLSDPFHARTAGIAAIYQQPALFPHLTVAENIALAKDSGRPWHRISWARRSAHAAGLLERIGATFSPATLVSDLTPGAQQLVELAKALDADARILIMDEPTASLGEQDTQNLYEIVDGLKAKGVGIIYITHRFEELARLASRVTVLRDGNSIDTRSMDQVSQHDLIRMMVGREINTVFPVRANAPGNVVLELRHLRCVRAGVKDVSLTLREREVLGVSGLIGSGRTQMAETIFGLTAADSGEILVDGRVASIPNPQAARSIGIAYVPEDRRRHGVVMPLPIDQNISLAALDRVSTGGMIEESRERDAANGFQASLSIKAPSVETAVQNLSGGNQQKVALARWLFTEPRILILDEPTQGIDVGAKAEIYTLIAELAGRGMAVLMISSELPEVLGLSDRIAVMAGGRIAGILDRSEATAHGVMELACRDMETVA
jgi:rhamnose transport system ATP-binding protein